MFFFCLFEKMVLFLSENGFCIWLRKFFGGGGGGGDGAKENMKNQKKRKKKKKKRLSIPEEKLQYLWVAQEYHFFVWFILKTQNEKDEKK